LFDAATVIWLSTGIIDGNHPGQWPLAGLLEPNMAVEFGSRFSITLYRFWTDASVKPSPVRCDVKLSGIDGMEVVGVGRLDSVGRPPIFLAIALTM
jgi:hypothetical protein